MRIYPPVRSNTHSMEEISIPKTNTAGMTSWSQLDPVHRSGNTDHWTKMKVRANTYRASYSAGGSVKVVPEHQVDQISSVKNPGERFKVDPHQGSITQLPPITFNDSVLNKLDKAPGDHDALTRPSRSMKKSWLDNCYQKRARDGFRYWLINRPKPTSCKRCLYFTPFIYSA
ncbi:hypothetical protein ElyMa_000916300 [Elysia marginata]|uniref:Uncharacterized protein n=1 Tax=Elysia marginata TaxID=1093978 RepID=A0AAV4H9B5_9GAST|nr:hypothetical protein ElyMa_000916300 [Elysia marginata]